MNFSQTRTLLICSVMSLVLCAVLGYLVSLGTLIPFDKYIQDFFVNLRTPSLTAGMIGFTTLASPLFIYVFSILIFIVLISLHRVHEAAALAFSLLMGIFSYTWIKIMVKAVRPLDTITAVFGWSFPSGHATMATIAFIATAYLFKDRISSHFDRILFVAFLCVLALLVAVSRVYLGAHFLSDALGGILLGLAIIFAFLSFLKSYQKSSRGV